MSASMRWPLGVLVLVISGVLAVLVASASGEESTSVEPECLAVGLARPTVFHQVTMHHAGLRPLTPRHHSSQATAGWFQETPLPEDCAASIVRTVSGQMQMQKRGNRSVWINIGAKNGNIDRKSDEYFMLLAAPTHAWPSYYFNECVGGKGWLKVRGVLNVAVKDADTRRVLGEQRFTYPAAVHGSCTLARYSKKATAHYKEEWGSGSGSYRAAAAHRQVTQGYRATIADRLGRAIGSAPQIGKHV